MDNKKTFTLTLEEQQISLILQAVSRLSWEAANPIIIALKEQVSSQIENSDKPKKSEDEVEASN